MAFGLVLYAVVVKHIVPHPYGHLASDDRWLLGSAVAAFVGSLLVLRLRISRKIAWPRSLVVLAVAALCLFGGRLPGLVVVGGVALLVGVMQAYSVYKYTAANSPAHS